MELINFIDIYENVFPKKNLKTLNKLVEDFNFEDGKIVGRNEQYVSKEIRNVKTKSLTVESNSLTEWHWLNYLGHAFLKANNKFYERRNLQIHSNGIMTIDFLKYEKTGHYHFHADAGKDCNRTLSIIYLINDNYQGGDLIFKDISTNKEYTVPKKANSLIIWPSNFLFPHAVTDVTAGIRYSIVSWVL